MTLKGDREPIKDCLTNIHDWIQTGIALLPVDTRTMPQETSTASFGAINYQ